MLLVSYVAFQRNRIGSPTWEVTPHDESIFEQIGLIVAFNLKRADSEGPGTETCVDCGSPDMLYV